MKEIGDGQIAFGRTEAVLNSPTESDFQDTFKNSRSAWSDAYVWKGTALRVMVASRTKVSF
jgi:hypothetical protein